MNILELLYDHYKDTCEKLEKQIHQRNKNFAFSFLITCVLLLFAINPAEYRDLMFEYIRTEFSIDLSSQFFVIQTLLWAVLLYETMRYSQVFANIERTYDYINALENKISNLSSQHFDRESGHYSSHFSLPLRYANYVYKFIFPAFSLMVALLKIISEFVIINNGLFLTIDSILCLAYILLVVFHIIFAVKTN